MKKEVTWCGCTKITDTKWLSHKTKKFFDVTANWLTTDSANSYFISNKKRFIYGNKMDIRWLMNYYAPFIGKEVIVNEEIMYSNLPALRKFEGSKILVVGGGPSAKEVDWDPKRYDYVFSCNHFYHNEKLNKHNVAFLPAWCWTCGRRCAGQGGEACTKPSAERKEAPGKSDFHGSGRLRTSKRRATTA